MAHKFDINFHLRICAQVLAVDLNCFLLSIFLHFPTIFFKVCQIDIEEDPDERRRRKYQEKQKNKNDDASRTLSTVPDHVPVDELDSEEARQRYL